MFSSATKKENDIRINKRLRTLANRCGAISVHICNGDTHPSNCLKRTDKNLNCMYWRKDLEAVEKELEEVAKQEGLTVEYSGLYPSFIDKTGRQIYLA